MTRKFGEIMRLVVFFFLFSLCNALECTSERIVQCLYNYVDINNDTQVDVYELNNFILGRPCGGDFIPMCGEGVLRHCDKDGDGVLTDSAADTNFETGCLRIESMRNLVCDECDRCDVSYVPVELAI